jgi:hypothetical protein
MAAIGFISIRAPESVADLQSWYLLMDEQLRLIQTVLCFYWRDHGLIARPNVRPIQGFVTSLLLLLVVGNN